MGNVLTGLIRAGSLAALLIAGAIWLGSCGGGTALSVETLDNVVDAAPAATAARGFDTLPSPREAAALTADLPESSRSYWTESNSFYAFNVGPGVTQELPEFYIHFTPVEEGLNYAVLDIPRMKIEGSVLAQVYLDIDWQDYVPDATDYEGFYVGYPDYEQDLWHWRGPLVSTSDFADFAGERIASNPDEDQDFDSLMLVNFSESKAVVEMINFTTLHPDDVTGDEWLYFTEMTDYGAAVSRAPSYDLAARESVIPAQAGVELGRLKCLDDNGTPLLVYNRRMNGGDWQVWQAGLAGATPQLRYAHSGSDYRFADVTPDGLREVVLVQQDGMNDAIELHRLDGAGSMVEYELPLAGSELPIWFRQPEYDAYLMGRFYNVPDGRPEVLIVNELIDPPNQLRIFNSDVPEEMVVNGDYSNGLWLNGFFGRHYLMLYSGSDGTGRREIHHFNPSTTWFMRDRVVASDPLYDLRYPRLSPDNRMLALVAALPGEDYGTLMVMSSFNTTLDTAVEVADDVYEAMWFDPTPPAYPDN